MKKILLSMLFCFSTLTPSNISYKKLILGSVAIGTAACIINILLKKQDILHESVKRNDSVGVYIALLAGADINARNLSWSSISFGKTPLQEAIEQNNLHGVKLLAKYGANLNAAADFEGNTSLHLAVEGGSRCFRDVPAFVEILLKYGAKLDIRNNAGQIPLDLLNQNSDWKDYQNLITLLTPTK